VSLLVGFGGPGVDDESSPGVGQGLGLVGGDPGDLHCGAGCRRDALAGRPGELAADVAAASGEVSAAGARQPASARTISVMMRE